VPLYRRSSGKRWGWAVFRESEPHPGNDSPMGKSYSAETARKAGVAVLKKMLNTQASKHSNV